MDSQIDEYLRANTIFAQAMHMITAILTTTGGTMIIGERFKLDDSRNRTMMPRPASVIDRIAAFNSLPDRFSDTCPRRSVSRLTRCMRTSRGSSVEMSPLISHADIGDRIDIDDQPPLTTDLQGDNAFHRTLDE